MGERLPPLFAEAIVRSVKRVLLKCAELGIRCRDPPSVITPLLRCLGYNEYKIRRFWSFFEGAREGLRLEIYRYFSVSFALSLVYRKETVTHLERECIPLDDLDYRKLRSQSIRTPHSHALYVYIDGRIEDSGMRLNVISALRLLYLRNPKLVNELLDTIIDIVWGRAAVSELYERILEAIGTGEDVLQLILPSMPTTSRDLLKISPILRRIQGRG